jgi:hypothetical protein
MAMSRRVFCSGWVAAVAAGSAPASFAQGTGVDPQSIVGEWTGTWTAGAVSGGAGPRGGSRGPYSLTIARVEGNVVRGTVESQGATANFRGTLSGNQLTFGNERVQTELTIEGDSMRGTRVFTGTRPAAIELTKRK